MKRHLFVAMLVLAAVVVLPALAQAASPPFETNSECLECHDVAQAGAALTKVDFAASSVDYNRCRSCHWIDLYTYVGGFPHIHVNAGPCQDCHRTYNYQGDAYTPDHATSYGYFDNPLSLATSPSELHRIHVNGSWPKSGVYSPNYCGSCHMPASCSSCHGGELPHEDHTYDPITGTYGYAPVTYTVANGTPVGSPNVVTYTSTSSLCVNDACHSLAKASTSGFTPFCGSCHSTKTSEHGYDSIDHSADVTHTVDGGGKTCGSCHAMDVMTEHEKASSSSSGRGCDTCHPMPRDSFDAWDQTCEQGGCHASGTAVEPHSSITSAHALPPVATDCSPCHEGGDLAAVHSSASTLTAEGEFASCNVCHTVSAYPQTDDCTNCHFAFADHYDRTKHTSSWTLESCGGSGCHTSRDLMDVHQEHRTAEEGPFQCAGCHSSPDPGVVAAIEAGVTGCGDCHSGVTETSGHRSVHWADPLLQDSNGPNYSYYLGSTGTQPTGDCIGCHTSNVIDEHMGVFDAETGYMIRPPRKDSSGNGLTCDSCHGSSDLDVQNAILFGYTNCETCHPVHGPIPEVHASTFMAAPPVNCAGCHDANIANEHNGTYTVVTPGGTSLTGCDVCHSYYEDPRGGIVQGAIETANDTSCTACHGGLMDSHPDFGSHTATTTASVDECGRCHPDGDATDGLEVKTIHAAASAGRCAVCHENTARVPDITAKTAECASCHTTTGTDYHRQAAVLHTDTGMDSSCVTAGCHTSDSLPEEHARFVGSGNRYPAYEDSCALCHLNTDATRIDWTTASADCATCHTVHGDINVIHTATGSQECVDCHETGDVRMLHGPSSAESCSVCHNATITLPATVDCVGCHGGYSPPDPEHYTGTEATHTAVAPANGCTNCHQMEMKPEHDKVSAGPVSCVTCHETKVDDFTTVWDKSCDACHDTRHKDRDTKHVSNNSTCGGSGCHYIKDVSVVHDPNATASGGTNTITENVFTDGFESGLSAWSASNWTQVSSPRYSGSYAAQMTSTNQATLTRPFATASGASLELSFWLLGTSATESSDWFKVEFRASDGTWRQVWSKTLEDRKTSWEQIALTIDEANYGPFGTGTAVRFVGDVSYHDEYQTLDDVILDQTYTETTEPTVGEATSGCEKCHTGPGVVPSTTDCSASGCHAGISGDHHGAHDASAAIDPGCAGCHFTYLDDEHLKLGYTCGTCHDSTNTSVEAAVAMGDRACDACHPSVNGTDTHAAQRETEFVSGNSSLHRAYESLPGMRSSFLVNGSTYTWSLPSSSSFLKSGWSPDSMVRCEDCHSYGSDPAGPHGASVKINIDPAYPAAYKSAYLTGSSSSGIICAKCHTEFSGMNGVHDESDHHDSSDGKCVNCHTQVPHGWRLPRLLAYTDDPAPYNSLRLNGLRIRDYSPNGSWDEKDCAAACDDHDDSMYSRWPSIVLEHGDLQGRVVDETGGGVSGAGVRTDQGHSATTDSGGYYSLQDLLVGDYQVTVDKAGYETQTKSVSIHKDQASTLDFTLRPVPQGTLSGKVVDSSTGAALSAASVSASGGKSTTTGTDGTYSLILEEGTWSVTFSKTGYTSQTKSVSITGDQTTVLDVAMVEEAGNLARGGSFTASRYQSSGYSPDKAGDGSTSSFWWSDSKGDDEAKEWIKVDLGVDHEVSKAVLKWYGDYYAKEFRVYVSRDGSGSWSEVAEMKDRKGGTDTVSFSSRQARYVMIECRKTRGSDTGYGMAEFEVYE